MGCYTLVKSRISKTCFIILLGAGDTKFVMWSHKYDFGKFHVKVQVSIHHQKILGRKNTWLDFRHCALIFFFLTETSMLVRSLNWRTSIELLRGGIVVGLKFQLGTDHSTASSSPREKFWNTWKMKQKRSTQNRFYFE